MCGSMSQEAPEWVKMDALTVVSASLSSGEALLFDRTEQMTPVQSAPRMKGSADVHPGVDDVDYQQEYDEYQKPSSQGFRASALFN
jgi:hypothetical protein